jgi:hypothetical protein
LKLVNYILVPNTSLCSIRIRKPPPQEAAFATSSTRAAALAVYWSEEFGKPVSYINRNEPFLVLCTSGLQAEVLNGDKRGWFVNDGRLAHHVEPV